MKKHQSVRIIYIVRLIGILLIVFSLLSLVLILLLSTFIAGTLTKNTENDIAFLLGIGVAITALAILIDEISKIRK